MDVLSLLSLAFNFISIHFSPLGSVFTCFPSVAFLYGILSIETYAQSFKIITISLKAS